MPTQAKAEWIDELTDMLQRSKSGVLLQTQGMKVSEITDFRRKLGASKAELQVVKNTLLRIAAERAEVSGLEPILAGQTTLALGFEDEVSIAKLVTDYARTQKVIVIKGGILEKKLISPAQVDSLAKTPPRNQVQAHLVGSIQGPVASLVNLLDTVARDLVYVLQARADQLGGAEA
ncbi:MAG TPA: 50S ribosomal protein L10 [Ktedonobacterales bacterium]|nr:50S ribosomal protein L10 [Ktedonobacterales bacterium]